MCSGKILSDGAGVLGVVIMISSVGVFGCIKEEIEEEVRVEGGGGGGGGGGGTARASGPSPSPSPFPPTYKPMLFIRPLALALAPGDGLGGFNGFDGDFVF